MAKKDIKEPKKALIVAGLIYRKELNLDEILEDLQGLWGQVIELSESCLFSWTNYYEKEMGKDLLRCYVGFKNLVKQELLPDIKYLAMDVEEKWSINGRRQVNIDPGILTMERFVLATTKNYTHRIYLGKGIFGDLTLIFKKGQFRPLEWTYPDYKSEFALNFLLRLRKHYINILKSISE